MNKLKLMKSFMAAQVSICVPFALRSPLATSVWDLGETPADKARLAYRQGGEERWWYPINYRHDTCYECGTFAIVPVPLAE